MRAGLAGGAGLRCCHTAMTGGPASAARMAIAASGQPAEAPPPGTTATARPAPISTPGPAATTAPRSVSPATCHSDPPRARRTASSPWRRATSIRAASRITAAPTTTRLTNRSRSTVSTAAWVPRNRARSCRSGELTVSESAAGASAPVSVGVTAVARFSALYSPCTWSAFTPPMLSGNSSCSARPVPLNAVLERAELVRVRDDPAGPEERRCGRGLLERRPHQVRVLLPEGRAGVAFSHDAGDEQRFFVQFVLAVVQHARNMDNRDGMGGEPGDRHSGLSADDRTRPAVFHNGHRVTFLNRFLQALVPGAFLDCRRVDQDRPCPGGIQD